MIDGLWEICNNNKRNYASFENKNMRNGISQIRLFFNNLKVFKPDLLYATIENEGQQTEDDFGWSQNFKKYTRTH